MTKTNSKIWGEPSKEQLDLMQVDTPLIRVNAEGITIDMPPGDKETHLELKKVLQATRAKGIENIVMISDKNPRGLFKNFAESKGLIFHDEYFKDLSFQLKSIILNLKFKFNRQRPVQVYGKSFGIDHARFLEKSSTVGSPSYPSGHAIQAHVISNQLAKIYPKYATEFHKIADLISLSRVAGGSHFPSDIAAGKEVAMMIDDRVESPYDHYGVLMEESMSLRDMTKDFLLGEVAYDTPPEKLRVLDFDDTIAYTNEMVRVETPSGPKMITSEEFAVYDLLPGEYFDPDFAFRQFAKVDVDSAEPVPFISGLLKTFVETPGNRAVLILTARGPEVEPYVMKFMEEKLGINNPADRVEFVGVANKDPMAKVNVIEDYLNNHPSIEFVSFYDDSGKNVRAVSSFLQDRGIKGDVRQVVLDDESGDIRLTRMSGERIEESIDERSIARDFFFRFS
jgi:hypothetical protein